MVSKLQYELVRNGSLVERNIRTKKLMETMIDESHIPMKYSDGERRVIIFKKRTLPKPCRNEVMEYISIYMTYMVLAKCGM